MTEHPSFLPEDSLAKPVSMSDHDPMNRSVLGEEVDAFGVALLAGEDSRKNDDSLFLRANNLMDGVVATVQGMPDAERTEALMVVTSKLNAFLSSGEKQQAPGNDYEVTSAIGTVVRAYSYMLEPETMPISSLRELTRLAVFCNLNIDASHLASVLYRRDHNELFGDKAPDFVRDPRFTSVLLSDFIRQHSTIDPPTSPRELMLSGGDVARATELHLMARGLSGEEAALVTSLWGTLDRDDEGSTIPTHNAFLQNLEMFDSIERHRPGFGVRLFRERRIVHFGRYPEELLSQQFEPLPEGVSPDFMILAHSDHNAAFQYTVEALVDSLGMEDLQGLRIAEADSPEELVRLTESLAQEFGPALNLIIGGHGEEEAVKFGPNYVHRQRPQTTLHINEVSKHLAGLVRFILPDGSVLLVSCSTGAEGAISEPIATILGVDVQAPMSSKNIASATRDASGHILAVFYNNAGRTVQPSTV
ncbi:MAG TPA: hypothetical protein VLG16_05165 [Candidatus Saccharimonadales bacterium]|nr:hypothetical protein [Candidatus Saccharimonadales bacterium]